MNIPETGRLRFRRMADGDLDNIAALLGDPVVTTFLPLAEDPGPGAGLDRLDKRNYAEHGYASEATAACREFARRLGESHLVAIIHPENIASLRVAEKVGLSFELTATDDGGDRSVFGACL